MNDDKVTYQANENKLLWTQVLVKQDEKPKSKREIMLENIRKKKEALNAAK